jgi:hypothetical protein
MEPRPCYDGGAAAHSRRGTLDAFDRPTLVATARDTDVVRLPPFDVELSLAAWWKARAAGDVAAASP